MGVNAGMLTVCIRTECIHTREETFSDFIPLTIYAVWNFSRELSPIKQHWAISEINYRLFCRGALCARRLNFPVIARVESFLFPSGWKTLEFSAHRILVFQFHLGALMNTSSGQTRSLLSGFQTRFCRHTYVQDRVGKGEGGAFRMPNFSTTESNLRWKEEGPLEIYRYV